jgi:hypothetical protein
MESVRGQRGSRIPAAAFTRNLVNIMIQFDVGLLLIFVVNLMGLLTGAADLQATDSGTGWEADSADASHGQRILLRTTGWRGEVVLSSETAGCFGMEIYHHAVSITTKVMVVTRNR